MTQDVPIKRGQTHAATAVRLNDDGDGVAVVHGMTVFVPNLLVGEEATITITQVDRRFARGAVLSHASVADDIRTTPACNIFGQCGGCQLQHTNYEQQLRHKQQMIDYAIRKRANLPGVTVHETLGMASPWRYRNQVQVPVTFDESTGRYQSGFFAKESHDIVETAVCHLEPQLMEKIIARTLEILPEALGFAAGSVHHIIARQSHTTDDIMIIFSLDRADVLLDRAVTKLRELPHVVSIAKTIQRPHMGTVWGPKVEVIWGQSHLTEKMADVEFLISPRSFFQVNTSQAEALYEKVISYADVNESQTVLDAYCGTGTMSLLLAKHSKHVMGIDNIKPAIDDAVRNAAHNQVDNVEFVVGDVENVLPGWVEKGQRFDVIVLDPPRKGCHPDVLAAAIAAEPKRIIYVSCNHATLGRDLRILADGGYLPTEAQPVDMFPQTSHVECVVATYRVNN